MGNCVRTHEKVREVQELDVTQDELSEQEEAEMEAAGCECGELDCDVRDDDVFPVRSSPSEFCMSANDSSVESVFLVDVGRPFTESARLPIFAPSSTRVVRFSAMQTVYDLCRTQRMKGHERRMDRYVANPWRRYGVLRTLHEIGGWVDVQRSGSQRSRPRAKRYVEPGSMPPAPPTPPQLPRTSPSPPRSPSIDEIKLDMPDY